MLLFHNLDAKLRMASPDIGQKSPAKIVQPCGLQFLPRVSGPTQQQSQRQRRCLYKTWNVVSQSFNSLLPQKKIGYRREKKSHCFNFFTPREVLPSDWPERSKVINSSRARGHFANDKHCFHHIRENKTCVPLQWQHQQNSTRLPSSRHILTVRHVHRY